MTDTKRLDPNFTTFEADGKKFTKNIIFSIERYEQYEKLQPRLAYGIDFESMFKQLKQQYQLLNDRKFADAAVISHNLMNGIKDVMDSKRVDPALLMCALAILQEGEDPATFDEKIQLEKIAAWRKEGYAIEDFFLFAASIMKGLPRAYNEYIMENAIEKQNVKITV